MSSQWNAMAGQGKLVAAAQFGEESTTVVMFRNRRQEQPQLPPLQSLERRLTRLVLGGDDLFVFYDLKRAEVLTVGGGRQTVSFAGMGISRVGVEDNGIYFSSGPSPPCPCGRLVLKACLGSDPARYL